MRSITCSLLLLLVLACTQQAGSRETAAKSPGALVYEASCVGCHSGPGDSRAPGIYSLMRMSPRSLVATLKTGKMKSVGAGLSEDQKRAVAEWITRVPFAQTVLPKSAYCTAHSANQPGPNREPIHWSGWGGDIKGTGFKDTRGAGLTAETVKGLTLKWAFAIPDATESRSQPALMGQRVFIGGQFGGLYALDQETGCVHWRFDADAAIRGAISVVHSGGGGPVVFFADFLTNVYALDASDGRVIWRTQVGRQKDSVVTGSVTVHGERVYIPLSSMEVAAAIDPDYECCQGSGAVVALDALNGEEVWYHRILQDRARPVGKTVHGSRIFAPSGAPVWSSPTVDAKRNRLYVGTGESYSPPASDLSDAIVALDLQTGELAWSFQATAGDAFNSSCGLSPGRENCPEPEGPDFDFGMAPIVLRRQADGQDVLVVGQKSGMVFALDPDRDGKQLWSTRVGSGTKLGGVHWGIAGTGRRAYATNSDHPRHRLPAEFESRGRTPGLYALDLMTGDIAWSSATPGHVCEELAGCYRGHSAAPTAIPGVIFAGSLDGRLRAHAEDTGQVIWEFDTAREFETVNGVPGRGGAIDASGPVVANGWLFVNSGYGLFGQMPGNLLMAFGQSAD